MARNFRALAVAVVWVVALPAIPPVQAGGAPPYEGGGVGGTAAGGAGADHLLWMKTGTFDPATSVVPAPAALLSPLLPPGGPASDGRIRFLLQFEHGVDPALIESLRA